MMFIWYIWHQQLCCSQRVVRCNLATMLVATISITTFFLFVKTWLYCGWWGVADSERVSLAPQGWYPSTVHLNCAEALLMLILSSNVLLMFIYSYDVISLSNVNLFIWSSCMFIVYHLMVISSHDIYFFIWW